MPFEPREKKHDEAQHSKQKALSFQLEGAILQVDMAKQGQRHFLTLQPTPTTKISIPYVITKTTAKGIHISVTIHGQEKNLYLESQNNAASKAKLYLMESKTSGSELPACPALNKEITCFTQLAGHAPISESKDENFKTPSKAVASGPSKEIIFENIDHYYSKKMQKDYDANPRNPEHMVCGKWVLEFKDNQPESLDHAWKHVCDQVKKGELSLAKVFKKQTSGKFAGQQSIVVYTHDYHDMHDLKKVLGILKQGLNNEQQPKIYYRPESYTHQQREDYLTSVMVKRLRIYFKFTSANRWFFGLQTISRQPANKVYQKVHRTTMPRVLNVTN